MRRLIPIVATVVLVVGVTTSSIHAASTATSSGAAICVGVPAKPKLKISIIGDSIAYGWGSPTASDGQPQGLRPRLGQLLDAACQPYDLRVDAEPGTSPDYWIPRIDAIMAAFQPDLVIIALGTNPNCTPDNGARMQAQMDTLYSKALSSRLWYVKIEPVFVTYSRSGDAPAWVVSSEPVCNDAIYRAAQPYVQNKMVAGYVSWDRIPTSLLVQDGIHYSNRAYQVAPELLYNAVADTYGWPKVPDACGLDNHRPGAAAPTYTPCPAS